MSDTSETEPDTIGRVQLFLAMQKKILKAEKAMEQLIELFEQLDAGDRRDASYAMEMYHILDEVGYIYSGITGHYKDVKTEEKLYLSRLNSHDSHSEEQEEDPEEQEPPQKQ